ncbi:MAG: hypothetical protein OCC45_16610 [Desulfotalea sp.]
MANNLQTTKSKPQECFVVELRKYFLLSLDDFLVVARNFINIDVSRPRLDRCLRWYGADTCSLVFISP